jgi:hypothetical protein
MWVVVMQLNGYDTYGFQLCPWAGQRQVESPTLDLVV